MTAPKPIPNPIIDLSFPHRWQAEILAAQPLILPPRHFIYPQAAEEVERGALEVLIRPDASDAQPFLATCALGFRDPAAPTGLWSTPKPEEICAVAGGYAFLIDTTSPDRFIMIPYRPALEIRRLCNQVCCSSSAITRFLRGGVMGRRGNQQSSRMRESRSPVWMGAFCVERVGR